MKSVHIGFSVKNGFAPAACLIRAWQGGTDYSHVYLRVYSNYTDEMLVYQASHGLVNCMNYQNFLLNNKVIREFIVQLPDEDLKACIKKCQQLLGRPYGYKGLVKLAVAKVFKQKIQGDGENSFHCSELIATLFPKLAKDIDSDFIEPVDLYKHLEARELVF